MKSYLIHLIRHGATKENAEGKYIGHTDVPLSAEGENELRALKNEYDYPPVQAVFSSPLLRCKTTADILFSDNKTIIIEDFIEYNFGEFDGFSADELENHPLFASWIAGEKGISPPFGESNEAFAKRVCECFIKVADGLVKTGTTTAAIVTHGGVIMTLLSAFALPQLPMHEWQTPNGCGYTIRITPSLWMRDKKVEAASLFPFEK